jgi:hypothetical protein
VPAIAKEFHLGTDFPKQLDTFVAARQHALVEVGALEFHLHLLVPHRVVDLGKVGAEVEFFGNRDHDGSPDWYSEF